MTTNASQATVIAHEDRTAEYTNGKQNGHIGPAIPQAIFVAPPADRADLPTFSWESGWREYTDPETGKQHRAPLTLLDILYPTEDDIGVVYMFQSYPHDVWNVLLMGILRAYFDARDWLFTHDVLIHWNRGSANPKAPDIAAIPGGKPPPEGENSIRVGRDGPIPAFVAEITSKDTRGEDLDSKPLLYAAVGIKEYLIIDIQTPASADWRLLGYRLHDDNPLYQPITPDEEGGLTFETLNLRFIAVGRTKIEVYDATTGERLLTVDEQKARAEAAEQEKAAMAAELELLRAQVKRQDSPDQDTG